MILIPTETRLQAFAALRIYIRRNNHCYLKHVIKKIYIANKCVSTYSNFVIYSSTSNIDVTKLSLYLDKLTVVAVTQRIHDKIGSLCFTGNDWEKTHNSDTI